MGNVRSLVLVLWDQQLRYLELTTAWCRLGCIAEADEDFQQVIFW